MAIADDYMTLTRVGPGTPMGNLLRRYWIPAVMSEQLTERGGAPVRTRLLGENLVAFRDPVGKLGRRRNRPSRCPRENPLRHRPFHYIPARRQPQTPSGQPRGNIGHNRAVGTHDKTQQRAAVADFAGDDAATLRRPHRAGAAERQGSSRL